MAWMGVPKQNLTWDYKYEPFIYRSTVGDTDVCIAERTCCSVCGSNVSLHYYLYPEKIHVAASTIAANDFEVPKVGCHIWTKHTPAWHTIVADGVPRYELFDPDFQAKLDVYLAREQSTTKDKAGWWSMLLPGAPDYRETIPDTPTMNDLWNEQKR